MKKIFISIFLIALSALGIFLMYQKSAAPTQEDLNIENQSVPADLTSKISARKVSLTTTVPILMYHHIKPYPEPSSKENKDLVVSPENFEKQLKWLKENNFQPINLDYISSPVILSQKPIVLTFDDGYNDAYSQVFPLLKKYNFTGTFFIVVGDIGKLGSLTKNQILEMQQAGMKFGSHSLFHPDLTKSTPEQAQKEIYNSKQLLEQKIGQEVKDFCYPGGLYNKEIERIVINSGYKTATTTKSQSNIGKINPFELGRLDIRNETDFSNLDLLKNL